MAIELYPDQQEALDAVLALYKEQPQGGKALVVAPTAWGKTIFFSSLARVLQGVNILIIAHRDELLNQARDKIHMIDPTAIVGKVGGGIHEYGAPITVAGIDTISQPKHLKNLHQFGYKLIICDECHHFPAPKYQKVKHVLPDAFWLGVTATDDRLDKKSLEPHFGKPAFRMSIIEAIQRKRLCDVKAIAIRTETNLDELRSVRNNDGEIDFNQQELAEAVDTPARNKRVVEAYREHAPGRRAICFCVSVQHAQSLAYTFNDFGIPAAVVSGTTSPQDRAQIYKDLQNGSIKVLCNVLVLTEGFDLPLIDCVIMARPTQSRGLYTQCIGRGLRLAPGKKFCLVLDLTDNSLRLRLQPQTFRSVIGKQPKDGETLLDTLAREEEERTDKEAAEKRAIIRKLNEKRDKDVALDLFALPDWQEKENGMFVMEVGLERHRIALVPCSYVEGCYEVWARLAPDFRAQCWAKANPLDWAMQLAEKRARMINTGKTKLVDKSADWRNQPMSPGQESYLKWKKIPIKEGMTRGEASDIIDRDKSERLAAKEAKEARKAAREQEVPGHLSTNQGFQMMRRA